MKVHTFICVTQYREGCHICVRCGCFHTHTCKVVEHLHLLLQICPFLTVALVVFVPFLLFLTPLPLLLLRETWHQLWLAVPPKRKTVWCLLLKSRLLFCACSVCAEQTLVYIVRDIDANILFFWIYCQKNKLTKSF